MHKRSASGVFPFNPGARTAWYIATLILLTPLIAMQFTSEVNWSLADFIVAGALLYGGLTLYAVIKRRCNLVTYRAGMAVGLVTLILLLWANGAVGIIGEPSTPANGAFNILAVLVITGALITKLRPRAMARVMLLTATLHPAIIPLLLLVEPPPVVPPTVLIATLGFTGLWGLSALLFYLAARAHSAPPNT